MRGYFKGAAAGLAATLVMLAAGEVGAQPAVATEMGEDDDAAVTVSMLERLIVADPQVWCSIEVVVGSDSVELTAGDVVNVYLVEDDAFFNDTVWSDQHTITAAEATAGVYQETFNCAAMGSRDGVGDLEFFAEADVEKAACTGLCFNDNPTTSNISVEGISDDDAEPDDAIDQAPDATLDTLEERAGADNDFVRLVLEERSIVQAELQLMSECGEIEIELVDSSGSMIASGEAATDSVTLEAPGVEPGEYFILVHPATNTDFNFYDRTISVAPDPDVGTTGSGDESGGGSTGDPDSGTGSGGSATSAATSVSGSGSGSGGQTSAADAGGDTDSDTDGSGAQAGNADGCGCSHQRTSAWPIASLALLLGLRRRRRR